MAMPRLAHRTTNPMDFARPPDGLRSPAARCAKLALAARNLPPEIPRRVVPSAGLALLSPRRVERELRERLARGARLVCDGSLRARPSQLLALGYRPRFRVDLFDTTYYLSAARQNEDLR